AVSFSPDGGNYLYSVGDSVNITIAVTGTNIQDATFTQNGILPSGLTSSYTVVDANNGTITISGIVSSSAHDSSVTFSLTDDDGTATSNPYNFMITLEIKTTSLPNGQVTVAYSENLEAEGGSGAYTWSLTSGVLPPGLTLSPSGLISGTPTTSGTYNFTATVSDMDGQTDSVPLSLTIDPAPIMPISNEGQICYVKSVVRGADGEITQTGDLYVKNLSTGDVTQITDFATANPNGAVLNPQLTSDGSEILFTYSSNPGTIDFSVYLTSTNSTLTDPSQGKLSFLPNANLKYATLSPDYDGNSGLLAYTYERTDRTELWVYNFATGLSTQVVSQQNFEVRHPVFVDETTIAFIGITNGIQDIYTVIADGGSFTNLTNNTPTTPQYGRVLSSMRNTVGLTSPMLIYSKREWQQYSYGKWDVYVRVIGGTEYNVSNTSDIDEFDPAFFGDGTTTPTLGASGQMFYAATLLSDDDIWQANYDTTSSDTNTSKSQRVTEVSIDFGLPNWSPVPTTPVTDYVSIDQTRFVYALNNQIYRANYDGLDATQLTNSANVKSDPNLARNGGTIVYTSDIAGLTSISKMDHDGTNDASFASDPAWNLKQASISPDGRWVVYAKEAAAGLWDVVVKNITGGAETVIDDNGTSHYANIESIYFNPDMTRIVYSVYGQTGGPTDASSPTDWDIVMTDVVVDNIAGTITPGTPAKVTNTANSYERYPSFSSNGRKIIFVSNMWDNVSQIFTMDVNDGGVELVVANTGQDFEYPVYGPVYDSTNDADYIAYLMGGRIYYAEVYRDSSNNPGATSGRNPAFNINLTGITPDAGTKFGWGILRTKGTVIGKRYLPERAAQAIGFDYDIIVDVDEASKPSSFTLSEILPSGFTVNSVTREGGVAVTYSTMANTPATGLQTLRILFYSGGNGGVADHVLRINVTPTTTGTYSLSGNLSFFLNKGKDPVSNDLSGNATVEISAPYIPVDIYDPNDTDSDGNTSEPNGIIEDYDLLYAIDCWTLDKQLQGYGPAWPQNINNWDNIILAVITIWSNDSKTGNYELAPSGSGNFGTVTNPQNTPGGYTFIGDRSAPLDGVVDLYSPDGVISGYNEMYWTEGQFGMP
ncbi:MAG: hypothetical protein DRI28_05525, partial [Caldiserica bacterium]